MPAIEVTTETDVVNSADGLMSLREALAIANGNSDADVITFSAALAGKTITLTGGQLSISEDVTINGDVNGDYKADITISGNILTRIFNVTGSTTDATLRSLTLTDGFAAAASGGAVLAVGINSLTIVDTSIQYSGADQDGGGLYASANNVAIGNTTFRTNGAMGSGGGAFIAAITEMQNTTFVDNISVGEGGGVAAGAGSSIYMYHSTVARNTAAYEAADAAAGGGIAVLTGGYVALANSVVAQNQSGSALTNNDVDGTIGAAISSVFGTATTITENYGSTEGVGNVSFGNLDTSGRVITLAPYAWGPLVNAGSSTGVPDDHMDLDHDGVTAEKLSVDAQGSHRQFGTGVDVGAVEVFTATATDFYSALDTLPLRDAAGDVADADALLDGDNETVVLVVRRAVNGDGSLTTQAKAMVAQANNIVAAATAAGHPLDVRIVTLDGTVSLTGLSGSVPVLHLDKGSPAAMLANATLLATVDALAASSNEAAVIENFALHRAPAAATVSAVRSIDFLSMAGHVEGYTVDGALEAVLDASGNAVNIAKSSILETTATTTRGQFDAVGEFMPDIGFRDKNGNNVNLLSYGGSSDLVVVSFCTQWCPPCQAYSAALEPTIKPMVGSDVKFLEVMLENTAGDIATDVTATQWTDKYHLTSAVVTVGNDPAKLMDLVRGANIDAFPKYLVIDSKTGKIVDAWEGLSGAEEHFLDVLDNYYSKFAPKNFGGTTKSEKFTGGKGFDKISGDNGNDTLLGLNGNDSISGENGNDSVRGGTGRDTVKGGDGADKLFGDDGSDIVTGGDGADTMNGGLGIDTLSYAGSTAVAVNLKTGSTSGGHAKGDVISNFENVIGSAGKDKITGDDRANMIVGGAEADTLNGGNGIDTLSYAGSTSVVVNLKTNKASGGHAKGDVISNFENVIGSSGDDRITGSDGANVLSGGDGDDLLSGGATGGEIDFLHGDKGNDTLQGGMGGHSFLGGSGTDTVSYATATGAITANLTTNAGSGNEADGDLYESIENLIGSNFADGLTGNGKSNTISGGNGNDTISGGGGTRDLADYSYASTQVSVTLVNGSATANVSLTDVDTLSGIEALKGGSVADILVGDNSANWLSGNGGKDTMTGGDAGDHFVFDTTIAATSADVITDFVHDVDKIDLHKSVMAGLGKAGTLANAAFHAANGATKAHDGTDRIVYDKSTGKLYLDTDGAGGAVAVHFATLSNKPQLLDAGDFVIV